MYTMTQSLKKGWKAKTVIELENNRELHITTDKAISSGVETRATVYVRSIGYGGYFGLTHAFALSSYGSGDFSSTLELSKVRCTENAVKAQHARHIEDTAPLLARVAAHYGAQEAEKVAA